MSILGKDWLRASAQYCLASSPCVRLSTKNCCPQKLAGGWIILTEGLLTAAFTLGKGRNGLEDAKPEDCLLGRAGRFIGESGERGEDGWD